MAYDLANFKRLLALPMAIEHWSFTTLQQKLVKIGAIGVRHGRYATAPLAEGAVPVGPVARAWAQTSESAMQSPRWGRSWLQRPGMLPFTQRVIWRIPVQCQVYRVNILIGIGFTMNLFTRIFAFEAANQQMSAPLRLGVVFGSILSEAYGYLLLRRCRTVPNMRSHI